MRATLIDLSPSRLGTSGMAVTCILFATLTTYSLPVSAQSGGNLSVSPTRVVFEGRYKSAQISLINQGSASINYRITFVQRRMAEDGQFEEIAVAEPGGAFADRFIRYSPRQVTLDPGAAQTIRLLLRKPPELEPGEYRSHLLLRAVPPAGAGTRIEAMQLEEEEEKIGVQLIPFYGVSIPVIVRHGDLSADIKVTDLAVQSAPETDRLMSVTFRLARRGDRSVYGDVTATWIPSSNGMGRIVQFVKGLAVYTPNPSRTLRLPLHPPDGVDLRGGLLKITFAERPETPGAVHATAEIPLS